LSSIRQIQKQYYVANRKDSRLWADVEKFSNSSVKIKQSIKQCVKYVIYILKNGMCVQNLPEKYTRKIHWLRFGRTPGSLEDRNKRKNFLLKL
jgi:hypothetical protein